MPKVPVLKNQLLKDLYLQLVEEISYEENEFITVDQVTVILSEKYVFELKFKKKIERNFKLVENDS